MAGVMFFGLDGSRTIISWPDTIQDIIAAEMTAKGELHIRSRPIWHFTSMDPSVHVTFDLPTREAAIAAQDPRLERGADLGTGMTRYRVNLAQGDATR